MFGKEIKDDILEFYRRRFGDVGATVVNNLLLSIVSLKCEREIKRQRIAILDRYRIHCLLAWDVGRGKSRILKELKMALDGIYRVNFLSECSQEALRGGVNKRGNFIIPEFRLCDIIIVPEMSSLMKSKEDIAVFNNLLTSLEDGIFRVKLLKLSSLAEYEVERATEWGVHIGEGEMSYESDAIMWMATYDLNVLDNSVRKAIMDRFLVMNYSLKHFPIKWVRKVYNEPSLTDLNIEYLRAQIRRLLDAVVVNQNIINLAKACASKILEEYETFFGKAVDERINLRMMGDLIRLGVAELSLRNIEDSDSLLTFRLNMKKWFTDLMNLELDVEDYIFNLISGEGENGCLVPQIEEITGFNRGKIKRILDKLRRNNLIVKINIKQDDERLKKYKRVKYVYKVED